MEEKRHPAALPNPGPTALGPLPVSVQPIHEAFAPESESPEPETTANEKSRKVIRSQAGQIDRLLIRQSLIEEAERRRLGRALHDGVAQDLAMVRAQLAAGASGAGVRAAELIATVDRVIGAVRTMTFELSPPVLEDLGLFPALEWLGEHLGARHKAPVSVEIDGAEPPLTLEGRTIAYRSVRELALNAVKHAPGAAITLSGATEGHGTRLSLTDRGPGFVPMPLDPQSPIGFKAGQGQHFGLLSVAQQIRGLGGRFEIDSAPGRGTRATIWLPARADGPEEGTTP